MGHGSRRATALARPLGPSTGRSTKALVLRRRVSALRDRGGYRVRTSTPARLQCLGTILRLTAAAAAVPPAAAVAVPPPAS